MYHQQSRTKIVTYSSKNIDNFRIANNTNPTLWRSTNLIISCGGESGWASEAAVDAVPPKAFLQKFLPESETFFVDSRNGMFIRGPKFGLLRAALENSRKVVKSLVRTCIEADIWMKEAATLTMDKTRDPSARPCREKQAVQVAQLAYGLAACRVV
ncbi:unnamed protein product [Durusdinium trenchii]|uniref:Uncharacterized protein n=1 Tax=Durusdinium trenchii TaxID=1381693 RepID=A0ABP0NCN4_9DINO